MIMDLLRNRNVLYVVLFLSVANLFSYLMLKQLDALAFFIIVGFLTTFFSKNMIIVMLTAMLSTFILVQINLLGKRREGMASGDDMPAEDKAAMPAAADKPKAAMPAATADKPKAVMPASAAMPAATADAEAEKAIADAAKTIDSLTKRPTASKESEIKGMEAKKKKAEPFAQKLSPARYNATDDDDKPRHKPQVDYAATLETAYDNLDKLLSSDAIRNMSEDTNRLAEKQQKLMGNIKQLTPIMDKAAGMLSSLDIGSISGLMGGIQDRLKGFSKNAAEV